MDAARSVHSIHAYFLRAGDVAEVDERQPSPRTGSRRVSDCSFAVPERYDLARSMRPAVQEILREGLGPGFDGESVDGAQVHRVGCVARIIRVLKMPDDSQSIAAAGRFSNCLRIAMPPPFPVSTVAPASR